MKVSEVSDSFDDQSRPVSVGGGGGGGGGGGWGGRGCRVYI